mmetsp:Transcript_7049/g.9469  ORF Transcript_7049/g.9469 Transcript_7049/m.9469 type:complete len:494 (+) Transcript_7049:74-1555(+)
MDGLPTSFVGAAASGRSMLGPNRRSPGNRANRRAQLMRMSLGITRKPKELNNIVEEGGKDLFEFFTNCPSLARLREEFRAAVEADEGSGAFLNVCARPDETTGRVLLHCIGLNRSLILISTGGSDAAISQVNRFIMQEILPVHPSAVIDEDNNNNFPFTETITEWINARRAVRAWVTGAFESMKKVGELEREWRKSGSSRFLRTSELDHSFTVQLKSIAESCPDAIICTDETGAILITNRAAEDLFGWTEEELIAGNIDKLCCQYDQRLRKYFKTGEKPVDTGSRKEFKGMRKDKSRFKGELQVTEIKLSRAKSVFCGFIKNLTDFEQHAKTLRSSFTSKYTGSKDAINKVEDMVSTSSMPMMVEWSLSILSEIVDDGKHGETAKKKRGEESLSMSSSSLSLSYQDFDFGDNLHTSAKVAQPGIRSSRRYNVNMSKPIPSLYREVIVEKVASIPHLMEELLLIDNSEQLKRVFQLSIVQKILFRQESFGDGQW